MDPGFAAVAAVVEEKLAASYAAGPPYPAVHFTTAELHVLKVVMQAIIDDPGTAEADLVWARGVLRDAMHSVNVRA